MAYEEIFVLSADNRANFQLRRMCERAHIGVTEASSTSSALAALKTVSPHVLLVHLDLPRLELRHFLQKKSAVYTLTDVPYVLMGFPQSLKEVQPGEFGKEPPAGWLSLPLEQKPVLATLKRLLKERILLTHELPPNGELATTLRGHLPAQLTGANESGFALRTKVRFETEFELNSVLQSRYLDETGLCEALWVTQNTESQGEENETQVSLLGVTRAMAEKIRKALGRRS